MKSLVCMLAVPWVITFVCCCLFGKDEQYKQFAWVMLVLHTIWLRIETIAEKKKP
jgi:hypothetical protein